MEMEAFLADSVTSSGGKLYVLGAGWNALNTGGFPARHDRIGIGVLIRVRAAESQKPHKLALRLLDVAGKDRSFGTAPDGSEVRTLEAEFGVGAVPGDLESTVAIALNVDGLIFESAGTYTFVLAVDNNDLKRLPFGVQSTPPAESEGFQTGVYL
jgi:hypothetical protein